MLFENKTKAWFTQSWCLLIKSTIGNCCSCCCCRGVQYNNNNNNCYWSFILSIKPPFLKKNWRTLDFFVSKLQNGSHQLLYIYIFSLFWLVHGFCFGDSRLPLNKCDQLGRFTLDQWCGVDFLQWPTVFWILFFEFHKVCWIRFSTWESFIGFHLWGSPISMSLACLLSVALEIGFRGKRGVGIRTMGAEMSSRVSSYLVYYILGRVNLSKLSRNKDNNN